MNVRFVMAGVNDDRSITMVFRYSVSRVGLGYYQCGKFWTLSLPLHSDPDGYFFSTKINLYPHVGKQLMLADAAAIKVLL